MSIERALNGDESNHTSWYFLDRFDSNNFRI